MLNGVEIEMGGLDPACCMFGFDRLIDWDL
jgi:hypothetical protein